MRAFTHVTTRALEHFAATGQMLLKEVLLEGDLLEDAVRSANAELDARHEARQGCAPDSTPAIPPPPGPDAFLTQRQELPLFSEDHFSDEPPKVMAAHRDRWVAERAFIQLEVNGRSGSVERCTVEVAGTSFVVWAVLDMGPADDRKTSPSTGALPSCTVGSPTRAARGKTPRQLGVPSLGGASGTSEPICHDVGPQEPGFESQDPRRPAAQERAARAARDTAAQVQTEEVPSCPSSEAGPPREVEESDLGRGASAVEKADAPALERTICVALSTSIDRFSDERIRETYLPMFVGAVTVDDVRQACRAARARGLVVFPPHQGNTEPDGSCAGHKVPA